MHSLTTNRIYWCISTWELSSVSTVTVGIVIIKRSQILFLPSQMSACTLTDWQVKTSVVHQALFSLGKKGLSTVAPRLFMSPWHLGAKCFQRCLSYPRVWYALNFIFLAHWQCPFYEPLVKTAERRHLYYFLLFFFFFNFHAVLNIGDMRGVFVNAVFLITDFEIRPSRLSTPSWPVPVAWFFFCKKNITTSHIQAAAASSSIPSFHPGM